MDLNHARLPIPPRPHAKSMLHYVFILGKYFFQKIASAVARCAHTPKRAHFPALKKNKLGENT